MDKAAQERCTDRWPGNRRPIPRRKAPLHAVHVLARAARLMTEEIDTKNGADPIPDQVSLHAIADALQLKSLPALAKININDVAAIDSDHSRRFGRHHPLFRRGYCSVRLCTGWTAFRIVDSVRSWGRWIPVGTWCIHECTVLLACRALVLQKC